MTDTPPLLDVADVARLIGSPENVVKELVRAKELVGVRPTPHRLRFLPDDVDEFIRRKRTVQDELT